MPKQGREKKAMFCKNHYWYLILLCNSLIALPVFSIDQVDPLGTRKEQKKTLFMVYGAADNDLFPFAGRNMKQMQSIGSNEHLIILFHLDMHRPGQPKVSKDFLIQKNKMVQISPDSCMDSGDPEALKKFVKFAIEKFPDANDYILDLWNHGTGPLEPSVRRTVNPSQLFRYNHKTKLIELDRSIGFLDYINKTNGKKNLRGICFDDTTGNYLTTENLKDALHTIVHEYMHGKKFSIIGFDACLMATREIARAIKDYAHVMVGSQEVELGTGWDYAAALAPYTHGWPDTHSFAKHIVKAYHKTYNRITHDFTQSAINLDGIDDLEKNVDEVATILIEALKNQKNRTVKEAIRLSRHKNYCVCFDEPYYIDQACFYNNLINNLSKCELTTPQATTDFRNSARILLKDGLKLIDSIVIANTAGKNLAQAKGISTYFPEYQIHSSYLKQNTKWLDFLTCYILA
jgi:hypothetical protein